MIRGTDRRRGRTVRDEAAAVDLDQFRQRSIGETGRIWDEQYWDASTGGWPHRLRMADGDPHRHPRLLKREHVELHAVQLKPTSRIRDRFTRPKSQENIEPFVEPLSP